MRRRRLGFGRGAVLVVVAALGLSGCSKKLREDDVPKTLDTVSVTADTMAATRDAATVAVEPASVEHGAFTDTRDGKKYKTVTIGGKRWMAENLNYKPKTGESLGRMYENLNYRSKSWCADGNNVDKSLCGKYGSLYNWGTALTVCPSGWYQWPEVPLRRQKS